MCGIALAIRRGRRREVSADVLVNEDHASATSGVEHVHLLGPKPASERIGQERESSVASQPPRASQERSPIAQSPKAQMGNLYVRASERFMCLETRRIWYQISVILILALIAGLG